MVNIRESKCSKVIALNSKRKTTQFLAYLPIRSMKKFMKVNTATPPEMSSNFHTKNRVAGIT